MHVMHFVQLRAFFSVAICGGFSRTAEQRFLTPPAIFDPVRKL
jgi:DNA-binding transcriptional LysR family regulator